MHEGFLVTEAFISVFLWGEDAQSLKARGLRGHDVLRCLELLGLALQDLSRCGVRILVFAFWVWGIAAAPNTTKL